MTLDQDPKQPAREAQQQLAEITSAAWKQKRAVESEVTNLKSEYAELLIDLAMNRSSDLSRKAELRIQIRELEYELADYQILEKGLEKERAKITGLFTKAEVVMKHRRTYASLKERITEEGLGLGLVSDLKMWAAKLNCLDDCEAFLATQEAGGKAA